MCVLGKHTLFKTYGSVFIVATDSLTCNSRVQTSLIYHEPNFNYYFSPSAEAVYISSVPRKEHFFNEPQDLRRVI